MFLRRFRNFHSEYPIQRAFRYDRDGRPSVKVWCGRVPIVSKLDTGADYTIFPLLVMGEEWIKTWIDFENKKTFWTASGAKFEVCAVRPPLGPKLQLRIDQFDIWHVHPVFFARDIQGGIIGRTGFLGAYAFLFEEDYFYIFAKAS
jgi:hypothetical protein